MAISSNEYVSITSVVGGASAVSARKLQLRIVTTNELVPTGSVLDFSDAATVLDYFGSSTATEYLQAQQYFNHVDKNGRSPDSIQFSRWADTDTSAQVFGTEAASLEDLNEYTVGTMNIVLAGTSYEVSFDLSAAASYAAAAIEMQTQIRALGAPLDAATVSYSTSRKGFIFSTEGTADGSISFTEVTADLLDDLGWSSLAIYSNGVAAETLTENMTSGESLNNNFGSFTTLDKLTLEEDTELALWNTGYNNFFQFYPRCELSDAQDYYDALSGYAGCGVVGYDPAKTTQFPWIHPAAELAAINWSDTNAMKSFMYTQNGSIDALVTTTSGFNTYNASRLNYFGNTQEAGTTLTFFQKGVLMGGTSDPLQMGVYAGEQWLKAEAKAQFLNMFLALPIVSADDEGRATGTKYIEDFRTQAEDNGVISIGKTLTTTQKTYITSVTGDTDAWQTVQREGSYYTTEISEEVVDGVTEYTLEYTFIYAKRDGVSKVEGRHILI